MKLVNFRYTDNRKNPLSWGVIINKSFIIDLGSYYSDLKDNYNSSDFLYSQKLDQSQWAECDEIPIKEVFLLSPIEKPTSLRDA